MTQPRPEQDPAKNDNRHGAQKGISPNSERLSRVPGNDKEDQADSGPDRAHPSTTGHVK